MHRLTYQIKSKNNTITTVEDYESYSEMLGAMAAIESQYEEEELTLSVEEIK